MKMGTGTTTNYSSFTGPCTRPADMVGRCVAKRPYFQRMAKRSFAGGFGDRYGCWPLLCFCFLGPSIGMQLLGLPRGEAVKLPVIASKQLDAGPRKLYGPRFVFQCAEFTL